MTDRSRWHVVHRSEFAHEQEAIELLRARLPDSPPFRGWSNFEFLAEDGSINEVDALVVSLHCVYLIEIKHWAGAIGGTQNTWVINTPGGRERYEENPLLLANRKAKKLKSLLSRQAAFKNKRVPFIQAAIFLSSSACQLKLEPIAAQHIYLRNDAARPTIFDLIEGRLDGGHGQSPLSRDQDRDMTRAMDQLGLRPRSRAMSVGDYKLVRLISENDRYQDWEAEHVRVHADHKRVRIFPHARKAPEAEKRQRKDVATREYELLREVRHEHILSPTQLTESELGPALLYDYRPDAQRLDYLLEAAPASLGTGERIDLVRQIAEGLAHAHQRGIHHRALSPWTIEVHEQPESAKSAVRYKAVIRDWQSGSSLLQSDTGSRMSLHIGEMAGVIDSAQAAVYAAPEVVAGVGEDPVAMDLFSLGALTYAILGGKAPAADVDEMRAKCAASDGLLISEVMSGAPDSLQMLVQIATDPDPTGRPTDVRDFLKLFEDAEDALTTPDPERGVDPTEASKHDRLTGGYTVLERLGSGSTCLAFAVQRDEEKGVLKIAKDPSFNDRLREEATVLKSLHHSNIVQCFNVDEIDGRTAILIEQAGNRTMAQRLRAEGALSLDLLERFGDELLSALVYLEREGINHRDIKPENIGIGENRNRKLTLKLFDFSLSRTPLENIRAGTPPYLDPFLCNRRPSRWDLSAERFAAAMTLHEMATGTLPTWGSAGQDPASSTEEVSLDVDRFDASVRDSLTRFFSEGLARNPSDRHDNADEMHLAWKAVFKHIDTRTLDTEDEAGTEAAINLDRFHDLSALTPLATIGLSPRELNAADRLGATTVGELMGLPGIRFYRNRGIGQQITRRMRKLRDALAERLGKAPAVEVPEELTGVLSVEHLVRKLTAIKLEAGEDAVIAAWLGIKEVAGRDPYDLPNVREVAQLCGCARADAEGVIDRSVEKWAKNNWMTRLRDNVADFVLRREGIVTLEELVSRVLSEHGSESGAGVRERHAAAIIQAVLETEAGRESARFVIYRGPVLFVIATGKLGIAFTASPTERAEYARALGQRAEALAAEDPLPSPRRVEDDLSVIPAPKGDQPLSPDRRLRLAAAAARNVALSSRLELYPVGLSAERALKLGANALLGARRLSVEQLHQRIQSRFPRSQTLPGRPALDHLLQQIEFPLVWREADERPAGYAMPEITSGLTRYTVSTFKRGSTLMHAVNPVSPEAQAALRFDEVIKRALADRRVLIVTCEMRYLERAAIALAQAHQLTSLSLEQLLIRALHAQAAVRKIPDWRIVLAADADKPDSRAWRQLNTLVQEAMPAMLAQLSQHPEPLLLRHLGLLIRYQQAGIVQTLRDSVRNAQGKSRVLMIPCDASQAPILDGTVLPIISPADWVHLPKSWLRARLSAEAGAANQAELVS